MAKKPLLTEAQEAAICNNCPLSVCNNQADFTCPLRVALRAAWRAARKAEKRRLLSLMPDRIRKVARIHEVRRKRLGYQPDIHGTLT